MYRYEYPRAALTVDAVVFLVKPDNFHVLLIKRKNHPFQNLWALPGGFLDMDETLEDAVVRELKEETGLSNVELIQLKTYSAVDRDPRGRTVSTVFVGVTNEENSSICGADDAAEAKWFSLDDVPELAFDHLQILEDARRVMNSTLTFGNN